MTGPRSVKIHYGPSLRDFTKLSPPITAYSCPAWALHRGAGPSNDWQIDWLRLGERAACHRLVAGSCVWAVGHYALTSLTCIVCSPGEINPKSVRHMSDYIWSPLAEIASNPKKLPRVKSLHKTISGLGTLPHRATALGGRSTTGLDRLNVDWKRQDEVAIATVGVVYYLQLLYITTSPHIQIDSSN